MSSELALLGSASTGVFHGFVAVKRVPALPDEEPEEEERRRGSRWTWTWHVNQEADEEVAVEVSCS